jgi:hypothetical protein
VTCIFAGPNGANARLLWEQEIVGSNPTVPTSEHRSRSPAAYLPPLDCDAEQAGPQPNLLRTQHSGRSHPNSRSHSPAHRATAGGVLNGHETRWHQARCRFDRESRSGCMTPIEQDRTAGRGRGRGTTDQLACDTPRQPRRRQSRAAAPHPLAREPRLGALLSSDDFGSSGERAATLHPLWQVMESSWGEEDWWADEGARVL